MRCTMALPGADPHFKSKHHKRRVVQPVLVEALAALLAPGARLLLQSDVLEVASDMRDQFERHGGTYFQPVLSKHCEGSVFWEEICEERPGRPLRKIAAPESAARSGLELGDSIEEEAWLSGTWAAAGWLIQNPLGVPTEREVSTKQQSLPVYRILLERV